MTAWTCPRCSRRITPHANHCAGCHQTFTGWTAFDAHRTGPWTDRTCLPVETTDGWRGTPRGWTNAAEMPRAAVRSRRSAENRAGRVSQDPPASQAVYGSDRES